MKIPSTLQPRIRNPRSIMGYIPAFSVLCLLLFRTVFYQTRYADSVLGFGLGTLTAYVLADLTNRFFPGAFEARAPEESELTTLDLRC